VASTGRVITGQKIAKSNWRPRARTLFAAHWDLGLVQVKPGTKLAAAVRVTIGAGAGPHAASLHCVYCNAHRGWPRGEYDLLFADPMNEARKILKPYQIIDPENAAQIIAAEVITEILDEQQEKPKAGVTVDVK
jgi:hypothetical protein